MSVLTCDILVEGVRRDDVLTVLSDPARHARFLDGAFDGLTAEGPGRYTLTVKTPGRSREMSYRFERVDEEHGGRRVHVSLDGRRTKGVLHYSLRTQKPSTNTLVTLHADIDSGGFLGQLAEMAGLRERLDKGFRVILENIKREVVAAYPSAG